MLVIMKAIVRSLFVALFVLAMSAAEAPLSADDAAESMKNCYHVRGEARYGALGYNHVVIVTNRCDVTLQCEVWTDVDPSPKQSTTVGPKYRPPKSARLRSSNGAARSGRSGSTHAP